MADCCRSSHFAGGKRKSATTKGTKSHKGKPREGLLDTPSGKFPGVSFVVCSGAVNEQYGER
jgi:hypothetical protein